jgi:transposase
MTPQTTFPLLDLIDTGAKYKRRIKSSSIVPTVDILDLPSLLTLSREETEHYQVIEAEAVSSLCNCAQCNAFATLQRHDTRQQEIKDIPLRGKRVIIKLTRQRYKCSKCGQVIQQALEGINMRRRITKRLEAYIEQESLRTDKNFRMIADEVGVDEKTVRNIFTQFIKQRSRSWHFIAPRCLGIDEVYIAGVARCVLTDVENHQLINILPKRDTLTVRRYLLQIKHPERIKVVVMDMWRPYATEVLKRFPHAIRVIDEYHVLRMATAAVMTVRRALRDKNKNLPMPKAYLLQKRKNTLTADKKKQLKERLMQIPQLEEAHKLKEQFFNVWKSRDRIKAEERYDQWVETIPQYLQYAFSDLLNTVTNWREEIFNYFDYRVTNAFTESVNCIIKSMQRHGRGYTFEVTRAKLLYGSPFVPRCPFSLKDGREIGSQIRRPGKRKRKVLKADSPPNPNANVQQLKRILKGEDEFTELMRKPPGYVERFKHFTQLDLY